MASSVARMPMEDWRDPSRIGAGACSVHAAFGKPLKVRVRDSLHARAPSLSTTTTTASSSSSSSSSKVKEENGITSRRAAEPASATAASAAEKRRQSRILDRWAARQAREMVTTIERQAHEAEISALSTVTQPVSARAATFLRETSPSLSESSAGASSSVTSGIDLPPNVRASSLIQMWRELEAEAGIGPTPRATANYSTFSNAANSSAEEPSGSSDVCDDSETYGDWESDVTAPSEPNCSSMPESERGRVGDIVRMLSMGSRTQNCETSWSEENETVFSRPPISSRSREIRGSLTLPRVRRRRELEHLLERMEHERKTELNTLAERQPVSRFPHRGRIQSLLRLRFLRREAAVQDQCRPTSLELNELEKRSTISLLRQRFSYTAQNIQQGGCEVTVVESPHGLHVQLQNDSQDPCYNGLSNQFTNGSNHYQEILTPRDCESTPPELKSLPARSEDLQEESQISDIMWEEQISQVNNLDWQRSLDSSTFQSWHDDAATEELELEIYTTQDPQSNECSWLSGPSNSWTRWEASNQATYSDFLENFPDNAEIHDLLERRRVSTSLASDFRDKMDHLILSFLRRQGQLSDDENITEEYGDQAVWRQIEEYDNANQVTSSVSLVPLTCHASRSSDDWQHTSFIHHSSQQAFDMEVSHDLRCDMAQLYHEISELRKLVESCMEWQTNLQHTIKQEVSDAVRQSSRIENTSHSSQWAPTRKGSCCICYEMQVDSLLYRCGHMCTCFKCAQELQWGSGRCPICRTPIVDVVRAYPNS